MFHFYSRFARAAPKPRDQWDIPVGLGFCCARLADGGAGPSLVSTLCDPCREVAAVCEER